MTNTSIGAGSISLGICLALSQLFPAAALAQDSDALAEESETASGYGDIIVTANRREQVLAEVPLSITAVSSEELRRRQINDFQDLTAQVPGFVVQPTGPGQNRLILRGQNSGSSGTSVATVIDDIPFNFFTSKGSSGLLAANVDTWDLDRIEILRGPQGTLYGAAAQGGLIKYVTRKPQLDSFESKGEVSVYQVDGGEAQTSVRAAVNVPIATDTLALRVSGFYQGIPGYIDNPLLNDTNVNDGDKIGGRASLLWAPSDAVDLRLTVYHQEIDSNGSSAIQVEGAALNPSVTPDDAFEPVDGYTFNAYNPAIVRNKFTVYSGEANVDLGFGTLTSLTSYGKLKTFFTSDITIENAAPGLSNGTAFGGLWTVPVSIRQQQTEGLEKFNQEVRLASNPGRLTWQTGVFYSKEDTIFDQQYFAYNISDRQPAGDTIFGFGIGGSIQPVDAESWAGFGDVTFELTPTIEVSGGARYTETDQEQTSNLLLGLLYPAPADPASSSVSDKDWTYSVGAKWTPVEDTMIYGRIATGFRPGGPLFANPPRPSFFQSDKTTNYEIGARTSLWDGRFNAEVTGFWIDWTDIQIITRETIDQITFTTTGNAGEARSKGIEWSFDLRPVTGLKLGFLGAYTDAVLTEDAPRFGGEAGDELAYVPDISYTLNADYDFPLNDALEAYIGGSYNYVGERFSNFIVSATASNHVELPSYDTVNLYTGIRGDGYAIQAYVRNVGNSRGIVSYQNSGGFDQTGRASVIQPRTFGLVFSAEY